VCVCARARALLHILGWVADSWSLFDWSGALTR